jgi:hypothetical protein
MNTSTEYVIKLFNASCWETPFSYIHTYISVHVHNINTFTTLRWININNEHLYRIIKLFNASCWETPFSYIHTYISVYVHNINTFTTSRRINIHNEHLYRVSHQTLQCFLLRDTIRVTICLIMMMFTKITMYKLVVKS